MGAIGATAGAWLAEFAFLPSIGLQATMRVGVLAAVGAGVAVWWRSRAPKLRRVAALSPAVAALLVAVLLPPWPREVFATGIGFIAPRLAPDETLSEIVKRMQLLYYRDGRRATISVDQTGQTRFLRSNGKTVASTDPIDMASQLLLGHLPMLLHPAPRDILVLGLSNGLTLASVSRYPARRIDVVEPEPAVAQAARLFDAYTRNVLGDSRVHLIFGDGRNRLLVVPKQYDVVVSEASDMWVAGAGSQASREFYRIVGARLNPGGIFAQSLQTQGLLPDDLDFLAATFHSVFPHMQIWTSAPGNLIFLGTRDSVAWDYTRLQNHFAQTQGVAADLNTMGIWRPFALFGAQVLGESESDAFTREIDESNTRRSSHARVSRSTLNLHGDDLKHRQGTESFPPARCSCDCRLRSAARSGCRRYIPPWIRLRVHGAERFGDPVHGTEHGDGAQSSDVPCGAGESVPRGGPCSGCPRSVRAGAQARP